MNGGTLMYRFHRWLAATIALVQWLCGCTTVNIHTSASDEAQVATGFGIVSVEIKPRHGAVIVESTSLGAIHGVEGLAIGYHSSSIVALPDSRCQLVVWTNSQAQLNELERLLRDRTDVCVVQANAK